MPRGPHFAARGTIAPPLPSAERGAPIDLGIALSIYGQCPEGRFVEIVDPATRRPAGTIPPGLDAAPTEH